MRPDLDAVEIMIDSVAGARAAVAGGASRVELCIAPGEGGLTPGVGLVESVLEVLGGIPVMALVRPRRGDFVYDDDELLVMERDIRWLVGHGVSGVVIGATTPEGAVDGEVCLRLMDAAGVADLVFHRAIDTLPDPVGAIDTVAGLGFGRVLSSGGAASAPLGAPVLGRMRERADGRLVVMAGGGVKADTLDELLRVSGVREVHSSASRIAPAVADFGRTVSMASSSAPGEYERVVTDAAVVRSLVD